METSQSAHQSFLRNARAATFVWVTLSILLTVLVFTVLLVPHWLGHGAGAFIAGHMGLYERCLVLSGGRTACSGAITNFSSIGSGPLQGATLLVIFSCVLCLLSLLSFPLSFCLNRGRVILFAGIVQLVVAILLMVTLIVFPAGWDDARVRQLCGAGADKYRLGGCRLRWAFPLAILTFFDAAAVAILALVLAGKLLSLGTKPAYVSRFKNGRGTKVAPLALEASVYARKVVDMRTFILRRKKTRQSSPSGNENEDFGQTTNGFSRMRN